MTSDGAAPKEVTLAVVTAAAVAAVHLAWWLFADAGPAHGLLFDGDSYARLLRVERLVETGDWYDVGWPRANAPYGGALHWTRPFDVLLLGLALPLMPIMELKGAL